MTDVMVKNLSWDNLVSPSLLPQWAGLDLTAFVLPIWHHNGAQRHFTQHGVDLGSQLQSRGVFAAVRQGFGPPPSNRKPAEPDGAWCHADRLLRYSQVIIKSSWLCRIANAPAWELDRKRRKQERQCKEKQDNQRGEGIEKDVIAALHQRE